MAKRKYTVGQILFFIPSDKMIVVPIMVVSEINRKTIKGTEVSFIVQKSEKEADQVDLSQLKGEIFETTKEINKMLLTRAQATINNLVTAASKKSLEWFKREVESISLNNSDDSDEAEDMPMHDENAAAAQEPIQYVTLPDGSRARLVDNTK